MEGGKESPDEVAESWGQTSTQPWDPGLAPGIWGSVVDPRGQPLPFLNTRMVGKSCLIFPQYLLLYRVHL